MHAGIVNGFTETTFEPDAFLTRGQMAKILVNAYHLQDYAKETPFIDLSKTFEKDVEALYGAGITMGKTDYQYGTHDEINRGDFTVLLYKTMKFTEESTPKVKSVSPIEPISVTIGTSIEGINLPKEVEVTYEDDHIKKLSVQWDLSELNLNLPGEYVINGEIEGISTKVSLKVTVHDVEIEKLADIIVFEGTKVEELSLPQQVKTTLHDGTIENVYVSWNVSGLNLSQAGEYVLNGAITDSTLTATVKVIVQKEYPDQVSLSHSTATLKEGRSLQLTATITPSDVIKKKITWTSSDDTVATVDQNGMVTAFSEGVVQITVTTENGKIATATITVSNQPILRTNGYASVTINNVIKGIGLSILNLDTDKVTVEKIEVYEKNSLVTTYNQANLASSGIPTEILPGASWGMSINYKLGIWKENSFVRFYINSNDKIYEFQNNL